ncbi:hypothetical protein CSKR_108412 [Clonorchis sinensis]|uniref:Uncharacterized protein n=1 Tax=Clonorchis sinensis TaxID=79923 RepID=A0A419PRB7_CLOSI|nr:hypothetical protein CSKR_108412 [Clonorchis sinensis]
MTSCRRCHINVKNYSTDVGSLLVGARCLKWLERESTDLKVRGSSPASASRLPLSRFGQPGSILALVLPSGGIAVRHRKGAAAERRTIHLSQCFLGFLSAHILLYDFFLRIYSFRHIFYVAVFKQTDGRQSTEPRAS